MITFAFDGSNDRAPAFLRLTRTFIFVRGATHVVNKYDLNTPDKKANGLMSM